MRYWAPVATISVRPLTALAVVQVDRVVAVLARQLHRLGRHRQPGAELFRLQQRPRRQLAAGDPGREAEVVLDPRGGAGLAAEGDRVDRLRVEALGGAVDRGRQAGRAAADDDQVAERRRRAGGAEPERASPTSALDGLRSTAAGADQDRRFRRLDADRLQQGVDLVVVLEVGPLVGHAVAGQELAQPPAVER